MAVNRGWEAAGVKQPPAQKLKGNEHADGNFGEVQPTESGGWGGWTRAHFAGTERRHEPRCRSGFVKGGRFSNWLPSEVPAIPVCQ